MLITGLSVFAQPATSDEVRPFQLSIIPFLGTDGLQTPNYRYNMSLNLFMGVTGGVEGIEAAGFMNVNNGRVEGAQFAGFGNILRSDFQGLQAAGFINVINGYSTGLNFAGFMNAVRSDQEGIMGAGFMNVVDGDSRGILNAGFMNVNRGEFQGLRFAGFMNVNGGNMEGIQAAGFMNVVGGEKKGIGLAGFANVANGDVMGTQVSGFMNVALDMKGVQLAGFLNVARKMEGVQVGFINVSDTITGIPIGFLSVVKKGGIRQFELSASDAMYFGASYKIGVSRFYNIFSVGYRPFNDIEYSATGYGIGTRIPLAENMFMQIEGHSYSLIRDHKWWLDRQESFLNELRAIYTYDTGRKVQFFGGLTFYNHTFNTNGKYSASELEINSNSFFETKYRGWVSQYWAGARAGVVFVIR